jgi:hypothetical protein
VGAWLQVELVFDPVVLKSSSSCIVKLTVDCWPSIDGNGNVNGVWRFALVAYKEHEIALRMLGKRSRCTIWFRRLKSGILATPTGEKQGYGQQIAGCLHGVSFDCLTLSDA